MEKSNSHWDNLGPDLVELILSRLPIPSIIRAASVCKLWNSIVYHSTSFKALQALSSREHPAWFFFTYSLIKYCQVFGFDPQSDCWIRFPNTILPQAFVASDGFFFNTSAGKFSFKQGLGEEWRQTGPRRFVRCSPLIGAYNEPDCCKPTRFIVAGGTRGALAWEHVDDFLAVEIYNPNCNTWETCPPLPEIFRPGNAMHALCSVVHRRKFYVLGICWNFISLFDLKERCWSPVRTLKPPGAQFLYLVSLQDCLVLAGLCHSNDGLEFILWRVDEETFEFSEIDIMPQDLLYSFIGNEWNKKYGSVKCGGSGNRVYMLNALNGQGCICEIGVDPGKCRWRKIPSLPGPRPDGEWIQKVSSFCFTVSFRDILLAQNFSSSLSCDESDDIRISMLGTVCFKFSEW